MPGVYASTSSMNARSSPALSAARSADSSGRSPGGRSTVSIPRRPYQLDRMYLYDISSGGMKPTAVTPVVLGLLAHGPRSGYDIKATVDRSTRFFWAASYGQIYPELRRLEHAGLIEGEDAPRGERERRVYRLTPAGRGALVDWLLGP